MHTTPRICAFVCCIFIVIAGGAFVVASLDDSTALLCVGLAALAVAVAAFIKVELERLIARLDGERELAAYELGKRARGL